MKADFVHRTMLAFSDDLASPKPTPGGGSAAAYAGALGAALCAMVANIAARKDQSHEIALFVTEVEALRAELLGLVDKDAEAYGRVAEAMKLPRATDEERQIRTDRLQSALIDACRIPLDMAAASRRLLSACERAVQLASTATASDIGVAAWLGEACLRGAALNVMVNLGSVRDVERVKPLSEELDRALEGAESQRRAVTDRVEARIAR